MNFDTILEQVGEFGPWQRLTTAMLWISALGNGIHLSMYYITGLPPSLKFNCLPSDVVNTSYLNDFDESDLFEESALSDSCDVQYNHCHYYDPYFNQTSNSYFPNKSHIVDCPSNGTYDYGTFDMEETIFTEYGLTFCGSYFVQLISSFVQLAFYIGMGIGAFCGGIISDKFGRKKALIGSILLSSGGSLAGAFMPEVWSYMATRLITGIGFTGLYLAGFTMSMEIVGVKERVPCVPWISYNSLLANVFAIPLALGQSIPPIVSLISREWRIVQWSTSAATFLLLILWILPESPRWLIANGKTKAAKELVEKIAKTNKKKLSPDVFNSVSPLVKITKEGTEDPSDSIKLKGGISDMFAPPVRLISIVLLIAWPSTTLGYFGLSMAMGDLANKAHVSAQVGFIISSFIEVPSYICLVLIVDVWGRKPLLSFSLIIGGIACIISAFVCGNLKFALAIVGKFLASIAFNMVYMFTAELFPTLIRSSAIGVCVTTSRIGAILAPIVVFFLPHVAPSWVHMVIMGVVSTFGGLLTLLLPEPLGFSLPDTFGDLEEIKKNSKSIWKCFSHK